MSHTNSNKATLAETRKSLLSRILRIVLWLSVIIIGMSLPFLLFMHLQFVSTPNTKSTVLPLSEWGWDTLTVDTDKSVITRRKILFVEYRETTPR